MEACKIDMKNSGVVNIDEEDYIIRAAITFYVKGNFGYDENQQQYVEAYEKLRDTLSLNGDYNAVQ